MMRSDRRMLLKGSVGLAVLGAMPAALRAHGKQGLPPAIFIYDARFSASRELAQSWQQSGVAVLDPREYDLGLAWQAHIPDLLQQGRGIAGATLWSDRFICETFARDHGLAPAVRDTQLPGSVDGALRHWAIQRSSAAACSWPAVRACLP